jgi:hypothetical protein
VTTSFEAPVPAHHGCRWDIDLRPRCQASSKRVVAGLNMMSNTRTQMTTVKITPPQYAIPHFACSSNRFGIHPMPLPPPNKVKRNHLKHLASWPCMAILAPRPEHFADELHLSSHCIAATPDRTLWLAVAADPSSFKKYQIADALSIVGSGWRTGVGPSQFRGRPISSKAAARRFRQPKSRMLSLSINGKELPPKMQTWTSPLTDRSASRSCFMALR